MKILVLLHIYYEEQLDYYLDKLRNINGCEWDLTVTGHNLREDTKRKILDFKSDARLLETPNTGYDVWPFICAMKQTDLSKYRFVLKLHSKNLDKSKNRVNGLMLDGSEWREELVDTLLGSPECFSRVRKALSGDDRVGLVYSMSLDIVTRANAPEDTELLRAEMARLGLETASRHYCGGTMFAVRASALEWLKDPKISEDIFQPSAGSHNIGTMAHVYERILCIAVNAAGYRTVLLENSFGKFIYMKVKRATQPFLEWLCSIDYRGDAHEKFLTLLGFRFKLQSQAD